MKTIFYFFAIVGTLWISSCKNSDKTEQNQAESQPTEVEQTATDKKDLEKEDVKKVNVADEALSITNDGKVMIASVNGQPFTGSVWSADSTTYVMDFKDGKATGSRTYHKGNKLAILSVNGKETFFDENGIKMTPDAFFTKYSTYIDEIGPQIESIFAMK